MNSYRRKNRVIANRYYRGRRRAIKASFGSQTVFHQHDFDDKYSKPAKRMSMVFPYFLQDVDDFVKETNSGFGVNGTQFYDSESCIVFEVNPTFNGSETQDHIEITYDAYDYPQFVAAYDNGTEFASGESFSSILVEVMNAAKEILIDYYNYYDEYDY